jgi:hypothetical protein
MGGFAINPKINHLLYILFSTPSFVLDTDFFYYYCFFEKKEKKTIFDVGFTLRIPLGKTVPSIGSSSSSTTAIY